MILSKSIGFTYVDFTFFNSWNLLLSIGIALGVEGGGQNKMGSGCMQLTMKTMCQNTCCDEKRPEPVQEMFGTMFFNARSKFFYGI